MQSRSRAMSDASRMTPSDQGNDRTCVVHAFSTVLAANMMGKYGVAIDREEITTLSTAMVGFNGCQPEDLVDAWNHCYQEQPLIEQPPFVHDVSKHRRYKFRVDDGGGRIGTIEEAYNALAAIKEANLQLMCVITMPGGSPGGHAVVATNTYPLTPPEMVALNSWGVQHRPRIDITRDNFRYAMLFYPDLVECRQGNTRVPIDPGYDALYEHDANGIQHTRLYEQVEVVEEQREGRPTVWREAEEERAARREAERRSRERELEQRVVHGVHAAETLIAQRQGA